MVSGTEKHRVPFHLPPSKRGEPIGQALLVSFCPPLAGPSALRQWPAMEITSFGETCLRMRGREGIAVADAFPRVVGPTGRGRTADIHTDSPTHGQPTHGREVAAATPKVDHARTRAAAATR